MQKLARLLALEDERSAGGGELAAYLADPDRSVRWRAALAAGRVADAALVPALVTRLNDAEPEVRQVSAFALGLIGDRAASERLLAALQDPDAQVKARAAEALGRLGDARAAPEIVRAVLQSLPSSATALAIRGDDAGNPRDPWLLARLGLFALTRLKDVRSAEALLLLESGQPRFDWWAAAWTALRLEAPSLKPVLLGATRSTDALTRSLGARGLGALKDASAFETLAGLTRDGDRAVAVAALRALASLGDPRGATPVAGVLRSGDPVLLREALLAVSALPPDRNLRASVMAQVGHLRPAVRAAALPALSRVDGDDFALVLATLEPDPVWFVRSGLAAALGAAADEASLALLHGMLQDEDARVLPSVLHALRQRRGAEAADILLKHLEHPDLGVRASAAENLAALPRPGSSEALLAAYRRARGEADLEARLALLAALGAQKDAAAGEALREAAGSDPSRAVRQKAASILAGLGQQAPPPGVEAVRRPYADYREAMAPYDPSPGRAVYTPRAFLHLKRGVVEIHLDVVSAPLTTRSFVELAERGFFDGLTFHRVVPNFVVQGGDPRGDGHGGPGYSLRCEIGEVPYGRGAVGMALSGRDTGGSQFFITLQPQPHLDGGYTLFGRVAAGMEVVDQIEPGDVIERVVVWTGR
jgi:cyclophilin family peptidyl-prolyl cis-trans isomerase/HEAT repeat protein